MKKKLSEEAIKKLKALKDKKQKAINNNEIIRK